MMKFFLRERRVELKSKKEFVVRKIGLKSFFELMIILNKIGRYVDIIEKFTDMEKFQDWQIVDLYEECCKITGKSKVKFEIVDELKIEIFGMSEYFLDEIERLFEEKKEWFENLTPDPSPGRRGGEDNPLSPHLRKGDYSNEEINEIIGLIMSFNMGDLTPDPSPERRGKEEEEGKDNFKSRVTEKELENIFFEMFLFLLSIGYRENEIFEEVDFQKATILKSYYDKSIRTGKIIDMAAGMGNLKDSNEYINALRGIKVVKWDEVVN